MNAASAAEAASFERSRDNGLRRRRRIRRRPLRVLTVGDGDLTYSLALLRAYGPGVVDVTATTLCADAAELVSTYPNAEEVLAELTGEGHGSGCVGGGGSYGGGGGSGRVSFGVDATDLAATLSPSAAWATKAAAMAAREGGGEADVREGECDAAPDDDDDEDDGAGSRSSGADEAFDAVLFNHPHLGSSLLAESEGEHALRHHALLSHYFRSAVGALVEYRGGRTGGGDDRKEGGRGGSGGGVSHGGGIVHVCLCGTQPKTWDVIAAAERQGLELISESGTAGPVHEWLFPLCDDADDAAELEVELLPVLPHYPAPRRYRNGRLGSRHFLGKYGYRHRRTTGDAYGGDNGDMTVEGSVNLVFRQKRRGARPLVGGAAEGSEFPSKEQETQGKGDDGNPRCPVCTMSFPTCREVEDHIADPGAVLQPEAISNCEGGRGKFVDEGAGRLFDSAYALATFQAQKKAAQLCKERKRFLGSGPGENDSSKDVDAGNCAYNNSCQEMNAEPRRRALSAAAEEDATLMEANTEGTDVPPPPPPNFPPLSARIVLAERRVSAEHDRRRLRWYCRRPDVFRDVAGSRKKCDDLIKSGRVYVNGAAATDSSRILRAEDAVVIVAAVADESWGSGEGGGSNGPKNATLLHSHCDDDASPGAYKSGARIVKIICPDLLVAFKPVGMRSRGSFSESTLESAILSFLPSVPTEGGGSVQRRRRRCEVLTKLETGCAGLCAVRIIAADDDEHLPPPAAGREGDSSVGAESSHFFSVSTTLLPFESKPPHVTYVFTALVHGRAPSEWSEADGIALELSFDARRWKSHKRKKDGADSTGDDCYAEKKSNDAEKLADRRVGKVPDNFDLAVVRCIERSATFCPAPLSTFLVTSAADSGRLCGAICYALRKAGFPVVNDRLCRREYASLPRVMRNILKSKLCIGCFELSLRINEQEEERQQVNMKTPERLSANNWNKVLCQNSG